MNAIVADEVSVWFGPTLALDRVTFGLPLGTSTALVGPNGSGKTTTLHLIAGLIEPTSGRIDVSALGGARPAYVLQHRDHSVWLPLTVAEVVRMGRFGARGLVGRFGPDDHTAVGAAADRLEIAELFRRQYGELSGGQRQRTLVAQALAQESPLLLLDEPITGLDLASQQRILEVVDQETAAGRTVVMSTHHLEEATRCDRVLLLDGQLLADGPPATALTDENLRQAYGGRVFSTEAGSTLLDDHGHGTEDH